MMKYFLIIVLGVLTCGCGDDKNGQTDSLDGSYSLLSITCECQPLFLDRGVYTYEFREDEEIVIIENNANENGSWLRPSGTYSYAKNDSTLTIEGEVFWHSETGDKLILDTNGPLVVDAPIYELEFN